MSETTTRTPLRHALVQARDDRGRTGSLHAARLVPVEGDALRWRTACGSVLDPAVATDVTVWTDPARAETVLEAPGARICRRCDRVGQAL